MENFEFPSEIPIDPESTLDQLTSRFRGVRDGLPELIKNSKDQYSRLGLLNREDRQIVVLASTKNRSIAVIDFAGAPAENFSGWTKWSDPAAGRPELADDIEAGHGNGGKSFMVRGATHTAVMESCFDRKRTRKGFVNNKPGKRYRPGFAISNGTAINNLDENQPEKHLKRFLASLGMSLEELPDQALKLFHKRNAFTGVYLHKIKDWVNYRKPKLKRLVTTGIPEIIASHGQTAMTLETCDVWVVIDGKIVSESPIAPIILDAYPGFEDVREFEIPDLLPDPETGDNVDMINGSEGRSFLRLRTSAQQLQIREETKAKNVIRVWNSRNNVATWPLTSLGVLVTSVSFIYGELRCPSLVGEHLAGAERLHLSDTPLVRALQDWTQDKVRQLADDLHRAMAADTKPKDREQARATLNRFRELMRRYLDPDAAGDLSENDDGGANQGDSGDGRTKPREGVKFGSRIDEIILESDRSDITVINGTMIPLQFRCIEHQEDGSVRPVKCQSLAIKALPKEHFELDQGGNVRAISPGIGEVWLETQDGSIQSNHKEIWVAVADRVDVDLPSAPLLQEQRIRLRFTFNTPDGPMDDALIEAEVLSPEMGNIGRHGWFTAGMKEGDAVVRVRFGREGDQYRDFAIPIGPDRAPPSDGRGDHGGDVPLILLCGDEAPGMEEYSESARTHAAGPDYPTIIEDRALFPNIVWINTSSKEAQRVRRSVGGSTGMGGISSKTFGHFVALKCFDILKRLHIRQQIAGGSVTEDQYMQYAAYSEIECADFVDAAWDLGDHLLSGR